MDRRDHRKRKASRASLATSGRPAQAILHAGIARLTCFAGKGAADLTPASCYIEG